MTKDAISIKGDRNVWIDFVAECKRQKNGSVGCVRTIS